MTDEELRDLVAETSRVAAENSRAMREMREDSERRWEASERRWEESQRQWQESREEILASRRETDRLITSLERRLGEIGNAFGVYTESTATRSCSVSWPPSRSPTACAPRP